MLIEPFSLHSYKGVVQVVTLYIDKEKSVFVMLQFTVFGKMLVLLVDLSFEERSAMKTMDSLG